MEREGWKATAVVVRRARRAPPRSVHLHRHHRWRPVSRKLTAAGERPHRHQLRLCISPPDAASPAHGPRASRSPGTDPSPGPTPQAPGTSTGHRRRASGKSYTGSDSVVAELEGPVPLRVGARVYIERERRGGEVERARERSRWGATRQRCAVLPCAVLANGVEKERPYRAHPVGVPPLVKAYCSALSGAPVIPV